ncbi:ParB/RepB/Spo0J family partition protein [Verrucosispora sp. WMMD1129]|uniref:ParB/RepB/Spo0J family partition protein n=1 Tax=Verrucosispora sp. WMMD1129 TaxID=3016093 RepID=UPI002499C88E|nr:ParB/RepB/Spo0J family partition protein [Verrucosispora sp. WMMD1129]WFE45336.1 ParB/RepB/Spo0J family partition protein [Verrucosispora sp. WMMD1129]
MAVHAQILDGALLRIPTEQVHPGPNARGQVGDVSELAVSISALGQQIPLIVEQIGPDRYRVIDGHRRLSAVKLAGLPTVDAVLRRTPGNAERIVRQLAMHTQARSFDPIAEAQALHHLMWDMNMGREQIARLIGKSPAWVRNRIALLQLSDDEQAAVARGGMSLGEAAGAVREHRRKRDGAPVVETRPRRHCSTCSCGGAS